jgi:hypothetical protein
VHALLAAAAADQEGPKTLVANKPKPQGDRDRRAKVEAMRKAEQARERRKSMIFVFIAVLVGVGLIAAVAIPSYLKSQDDPKNKALSSFGVAASAASCGDVQTKDAGDSVGKHVADGTVEKYDTVPPSYGPHWAQPAYPAREFYTTRDRPEMEQLVHNLEHGYTIVWYDKTIKGAQLDELKDIATRARTEDAVGPTGKFIVSAWDNAYGTFPSGKHVGISHWSAKAGNIQLCGKVSGAAVQSFIDDFPASDSPEPAAA